MTCATCHYWVQFKTTTVGECHRYPPSIPEQGTVVFGGRITSSAKLFGGITENCLSPRTGSGFWCGEYAESGT